MSSLDLWHAAPTALSLPHGEAHLWRISLARSPAESQALEALLSADERERARRYRFSHDRARFVAGRGMLRLLLARYSGGEPGELRFSYGPYGKPVLSAEAGMDALSFNLAHADDLALLAVARGRSVGVDLERVRADLASEGVAAQVFTPLELSTLPAAEPARRLALFYCYWTRKEAYLKAHGAGLSRDPRAIDVSGASGQPPSLCIDDGATRWFVQDLYPAKSYAAALAVDGAPPRLVCWQAP